MTLSCVACRLFVSHKSEQTAQISTSASRHTAELQGRTSFNCRYSQTQSSGFKLELPCSTPPWAGDPPQSSVPGLRSSRTTETFCSVPREPLTDPTKAQPDPGGPKQKGALEEAPLPYGFLDAPKQSERPPL